MNDEVKLTKNEETVLRAIYAFCERNQHPDEDGLAKMTGLSADEIAAATRFLEQIGFITPGIAAG